MKIIKRATALLLILSVIMGVFCVTASAEAVNPRLNYIAATSTSLSFNNDVAQVWLNYDCHQGNSVSVKVTTTLQKKFMLFWWTDLTTWTDTSTNIEDTFYHTYETSSGTHRVIASYEVTIVTSGATETVEDEVEVKN